jgi:drug/metabolite transporter (DMT)-like permease
MPQSGLDAIVNLETSNTAKVGIANMIYRLFLFTTAVMPLASLFWNVNFFWIKANWIPYPIFLIAVIFMTLFRKSVPREYVFLIFFAAFYLVLSYFNGGDAESIGRFIITILPLTFYFMFENIKGTNHQYFWWIYGALMIIPIINSYLQYTGRIPYDEFDYVNDERIGRMSGGYQKPHNLVAYLVPIFLLGFYIWKVKQKRIIGIVIVFVVLIGVYMINYRTSLIAFLAILLSSFFMKTTKRLVYAYYQYFLNFFLPISAFIGFRILLSTFGLWDKLRGRVPIWEIHSQQFFDQSILKIIFGTQNVIIKEVYRQPSVYLIDEAHNNSFRTIIVFGLLGFFLYCLFMRKIVISIKRANYLPKLEFILLSSFIYFIFYTTTNEPAYYGSVLWPVLIWIFLAQSMSSKQITSSINN